jgi:uncharacterized small protein (DUF1192 family)
MTEIKMSNEGIYAITIKGLILVVLIWIFGMILYSFVQIAFGYQRVNENTTNTEFLGLLFIASIVIVACAGLIIGKMLQANLSIETREKELLLKKGLILPKEIKTPYSELKEARLASAFLDFIDNFFEISAISIEDSKVIVINGVKQPIDSVREINDRIAANKRKGMTVEDLAKEVKALRDEIEALKAAYAAKKEKKIGKEAEEEEKKKGRFGFGPLKEEV